MRSACELSVQSQTLLMDLAMQTWKFELPVCFCTLPIRPSSTRGCWISAPLAETLRSCRDKRFLSQLSQAGPMRVGARRRR